MPRVLIIDDDPHICRLFDITLSKAGYEVFIAYDAEKGYQLAQEHLPDVILSDYMLPQQNGEELCKTIRANPTLADIPFIVITGKGTPRLKTEGLSQQFDDYLEKPVDLQYLLAKVNAVIRRRKDELQNVHQKTSKLRRIAVGLMIVFTITIGVSLGFKLQVASQKKELKHLRTINETYDKRILVLENQLDSLGSQLDERYFDRFNEELQRLIRRVNTISEALPPDEEKIIILQAIKEILTKFVEANYSVPPWFCTEMALMIDFFLKEDRSQMLSYLKQNKSHLLLTQAVFRENGLSEELSDIDPWEHGFFASANDSESNGAGLWQLTPPLAGMYDLHIDNFIDAGMDPLKPQWAAEDYGLNLSHIHGNESLISALSSYPERYSDPVERQKFIQAQQKRDFWYYLMIDIIFTNIWSPAQRR